MYIATESEDRIATAAPAATEPEEGVATAAPDALDKIELTIVAPVASTIEVEYTSAEENSMTYDNHDAFKSATDISPSDRTMPMNRKLHQGIPQQIPSLMHSNTSGPIKSTPESARVDRKRNSSELEVSLFILYF